MSLDVYLMSELPEKKICPHCDSEYETREEYFSANITHNLNVMADKAGIYYALWHPEKIEAVYAKDIIQIVEDGLFYMESKPDYFKQFSASNGWGTYEQFVPWVRKYLSALKEYPNSIINTSV